jgi:hypothetical protein
VLLNELFRDYLRFNGYNATLSVFLAETSQPPEPALDRVFLAKELGITETLPASFGNSSGSSGAAAPGEGDLPLAYGLLLGYTQARDMQRELMPLISRHHALAAQQRPPHASTAALPPPLRQSQQHQQHQQRTDPYSGGGTSTYGSGGHHNAAARTSGSAPPPPPSLRRSNWGAVPPPPQQPQQPPPRYAPASLYAGHHGSSGDLALAATSAFAPLRTEDLRGVTGEGAGGWRSAASGGGSSLGDAGSGRGSSGLDGGGSGGGGSVGGFSGHRSADRTPSPPRAADTGGRASAGSATSNRDFRAAASTALPESPCPSQEENKDDESMPRGGTSGDEGAGLVVIVGANTDGTNCILEADSVIAGGVASGGGEARSESEANQEPISAGF